MNIEIAKTKLCPIVTSNNDDAYCQAGDCMMWESVFIREEKEIEIEDNPRLSFADQIPDGYFHTGTRKEHGVLFLKVYRWEEDQNNGDCGMKPKELECNCG